MGSPLSTFGILRLLFPRIAASLVLGLCAVVLFAPDAATRIFTWAIHAETTFQEKRLQRLFDASLTGIEGAKAESFHEEQKTAVARALKRSRRGD